MGVCYVFGSLVSHRLTVRGGERRVLSGVLVLQVLTCAGLAWRPARRRSMREWA